MAIVHIVLVVLCSVLVRGSTLDRIEEELDSRSSKRLDELLENVFERLEKRREPAIAEVEKVGAEGIDFLPVKPPVLQKPCCEKGETIVDLREGGVCHTNGGAAEVLTKPTGPASDEKQCNKQAVLKVAFDKLESCTCCAKFPECGRRMLRIDLELSSGPRSGFMFNIGDSKSNNGYAGDSNDQFNDAELDGSYPNIKAWASDKCKVKPLKTYANALVTNAVSHVTMYVSNEHVRVTNDNGLDEYLCHECLFALNGQPDSSRGGINEDIYVALNRVVAGGRIGVGVCSAKLSWVCPDWH
ncbi:uncharacterized protein LOC128234794 [Mya arenaria]|uniref:uncharacterized protein LOC128234794 n=1 Tax=Mya arenaria TaxID=6604 RepID=UPI0022E7BC4C|nr:uncharacterized protein LOC128234794 [Mya arenaria]